MNPAHVYVRKSEKPNKAFTAVIMRENGRVKHIEFGDRRGSQYWLHKDPAKKRAWIARHSVRENWNDPFTAGFWSRWLLWNKETLGESARDIEQRFGFRIMKPSEAWY